MQWIQFGTTAILLAIALLIAAFAYTAIVHANRQGAMPTVRLELTARNGAQARLETNRPDAPLALPSPRPVPAPETTTAPTAPTAPTGPALVRPVERAAPLEHPPPRDGG